MVVQADPVCDHAAGVLQGFEPVAMHALVFERSDHALDHAVLLRAVGNDELLLQAMAPDPKFPECAGYSMQRACARWPRCRARTGMPCAFLQDEQILGWLDAALRQFTTEILSTYADDLPWRAAARLRKTRTR